MTPTTTTKKDAGRTNCVSAACGDGIVQLGVEACDDGNNVDGRLPEPLRRGGLRRRVVRENVETCDDGNNVDTDACRASCVPAALRRRGRPSGVDECDDGNDVDRDDCRDTCRTNRSLRASPQR